MSALPQLARFDNLDGMLLAALNLEYGMDSGNFELKLIYSSFLSNDFTCQVR